MPEGEYLQYGGQAIIEGVMMRSPRHFGVAVRAPNGSIVLQAEPLVKTWIGRQKWLKAPFLRGTLALLDALALGYRALKFSSNVQLDPQYQPNSAELATPAVAATDGKASRIHRTSESLKTITVGIAMLAGLAIGLFLFNYLPNLLAIQFKSLGVQNPTWINFTTEVIKIVFFLGYIWLISFMPDIRRVFEYHGAEHKAINTLEAGEELTLENCRKQTRLHPRCGTSFAIVVLIVSMVVFTFMPKPEIEGSRFLTSVARFLVELPVLPVIAGISFEIIRFAGKMRSSALVTGLLWPGLKSQYLTTREPDETQIEVALVALKAVVDAEEAEKASKETAAPEPEEPLSAAGA